MFCDDLRFDSLENEYSARRFEVKLEAVKSPGVGAIAKANFDITVKTGAPEDRIQRIFHFTVKIVLLESSLKEEEFKQTIAGKPKKNKTNRLDIVKR